MGVLPAQRTPPKQRLEDLSILIYGRPKLGKTRWAAGFENGVFLATEAGQGAVDAYLVPIDRWETLLQACAELAAGQHHFSPIIVDTVDLMYALCQDYIRRKHNVAYEGDLAFGKGFTLVLDEFTRVLLKMSHLGLGLVMIGHCEYETVETRVGAYQRAVPQLKDKARRFICGLADVILHCDLEAEAAGGTSAPRRVIHTKPSQFWEGGDRTGRLPETLPLDFDAFRAAFEAAMQSPCPAPPGLGDPTASQGDA
jgi:hypothetical protein